MKRCAVFSSKGLGDGLIALVLSNNLRLNGREVTTFHPFLQGLQGWFPLLNLQPFPSLEALSAFDSFFFFYEKSEWMQEVLSYCQRHFPNQLFVLNPIATQNRDYPYWEVGQFDGRFALVDNLVTFCQKQLGLSQVVKENGIVAPEKILRVPNRVVLHPTSSRKGKDWAQEKFIALSFALKQEGFEPYFVLHEKEREEWDLTQIEAPTFANLAALAQAVCASGYMIGNDSGIGHLASCLGVPTLTICRSAQSMRFWRPAWAKGRIVTPYSWIPNIKGLRLRDRHWKRLLSVSRVLREFKKLSS